MPALGTIFHPRFPPDTLIDYARRAEAAGFDELWLWNDCFLPGAFTSAAVALSATEHLKVGIGLLPVTVYNPLFVAMEITTLACAFPGRFLPGFGHGVKVWMKQIGAAPVSSMKTLEQTMKVIADLLRGERVTVHAHGVDLDDVQMEVIPDQVPPLYIGAMREKSLQLSGRIANGTILTSMSAPVYVQWAREQIDAGIGQREADQADHRVVVYTLAKVNPDGQAARDAMRRSLAEGFPTWADVHLDALGITGESHALHQQYGEDMARHLPDAWVDAFSASGTPEQAAAAIERLAGAGVDAVILQPQADDPGCLDEYIDYLVPMFR
ncbi:MAG: LLM class flavin-dependent oxidoreductase [Anaerolineae bacterium]|nr:LLM class flavin-dependent oxidoreductase [Anaerolineae bacterium]